MPQYQEQLIKEVKKLCKREQTVENFIDLWIRSGETFKSLYQLLLSRGVETNRNSVYKTFRSMLGLPYSTRDAFLYKWNAIARTKGFANAKQMIAFWKKQKYNNRQIAEELGRYPRGALNTKVLIDHILSDGTEIKTSKSHPYPKKRNEGGFSRKDRAEEWLIKLNDMGFSTFREAVDTWKSRGLNYTDMAKLIGISVRAFRWRRKRLKEVEESQEFIELPAVNMEQALEISSHLHRREGVFNAHTSR